MNIICMKNTSEVDSNLYRLICLCYEVLFPKIVEMNCCKMQLKLSCYVNFKECIKKEELLRSKKNPEEKMMIGVRR